MMGKEKLMSIQETSEMLNVFANSLKRWIKDGKIKAFKLGRL